MPGLALVVAGLALGLPGAAHGAVPETPASAPPDGAAAANADFRSEPRSEEARIVADWVSRSGDNRRLPFVIVDKVDARVFAFDGYGRLTGAAAALLGLGRGDDSVPGIGQRRLATIRPEERTTPAGRFVAALGHDLKQDVLWIDYDAAVSLHRVIVGRPEEARSNRLGSASALDNRISYGCINVPPEFYDTVIAPAFKGTVGIVYILPDTKPLREVFAMGDLASTGRPRPASQQYPHLDDSRLPARR